MAKAAASKAATWFAEGLGKGIEGVESISLTGDEIVVLFKSEDIPVKDVLDIMERAGDIHYAEQTFCRREGKGPELILSSDI